MIRKNRIVQCRLSDQEFQQYAPLARMPVFGTWSTLLRWALLKLWKEEVEGASDKSVIQSNGKTKQRQAKPGVVPKRYRPSLPAAKSPTK